MSPENIADPVTTHARTRRTAMTELPGLSADLRGRFLPHLVLFVAHTNAQVARL